MELNAMITSVSLGNLGKSDAVCGTGMFETMTDRSVADQIASINLSCPFGTLSSVLNWAQQSETQTVNCVAIIEAEKVYKRGEINPELSPIPETCQFHTFTEDYKTSLTDLFELQCKGNQQCNFEFDSSNIPEDLCVSQYQRSNSGAGTRFVMTASCISDEVRMDLHPSIASISKENVSILIVVFDIFASFSLWFGLLYIRPFSRAIAHDIDGSHLEAEDFTVTILQIPHKDKIDDLKAVYWAWAE